jgi:Zn-dependent membrane protease YugP
LYYPMLDPTILLLIPAMIFSMWAQFKVKSAYSKYSEVMSERGVTSDQAARSILDQYGLTNINIEHIQGQLTDHYDPRAKVLRLSESVAGNTSIAAIGVAAHECGHAIQDKENYAFLRFRNAIVPVVNIASTLSMPLFFIGLLMSWLNLLDLGIALFCGVLVFHLVTLPVEFDASARALRILSDTGLLEGNEIYGAKKVLSAAALTYVAALVMTILQLLRLLALRNSRRN